MSSTPHGPGQEGQRVFGGDQYGSSTWNAPPTGGYGASPQGSWNGAPMPEQGGWAPGVGGGTQPGGGAPGGYGAARPAASGYPQQTVPQPGPTPWQAAGSRPGTAGAPPHPSPASGSRRRRGGMIALVTAVVLALIVGGGVAWELGARGSAVDRYTAALESQHLVVSGADAGMSASGEFRGGLAVIESMGDRWSGLAIEANVHRDAGDGFVMRYELQGAPVSATGAIDEAVMSTELSPAIVMDILYGVRNPWQNADVEFADGVMRVSARDEQGTMTVSEWAFSVRDGEFHREVVRAEHDGMNILHMLESTESTSDWCEVAGLESTLESVEVGADALSVRWRISALEVADLALASCVG